MSDGGRRVLVVEDDAIVAIALCDDLEDLKFVPVGPYASIEESLDSVNVSTVDLALVDLNLEGTMSYPLLDELVRSGIPAAIMTGYTDGAIPSRYSELPRLAKPFSIALLREILSKMQVAAQAIGRPAPPETSSFQP